MFYFFFLCFLIFFIWKHIKRIHCLNCELKLSHFRRLFKLCFCVKKHKIFFFDVKRNSHEQSLHPTFSIYCRIKLRYPVKKKYKHTHARSKRNCKNKIDKNNDNTSEHKLQEIPANQYTFVIRVAIISLQLFLYYIYVCYLWSASFSVSNEALRAIRE